MEKRGEVLITAAMPEVPSYSVKGPIQSQLRRSELHLKVALSVMVFAINIKEGEFFKHGISTVAGAQISGPAAERPNVASRCEAAISRFCMSAVVLSFFVRTKGLTFTA